eukprot:1370885-Amorphochlora_amoeboformis.AAC.1
MEQPNNSLLTKKKSSVLHCYKLASTTLPPSTLHLEKGSEIREDERGREGRRGEERREEERREKTHPNHYHSLSSEILGW